MNIGLEFVNSKDHNKNNEIEVEHIAYDSDNNILESDSSDESGIEL